MPTTNKMVSFAVPNEDYQKILEHQKNIGANRTQTILDLIRLGIRSIDHQGNLADPRMRKKVDNLISAYLAIDDDGRDAVDSMISREVRRVELIAKLQQTLEGMVGESAAASNLSTDGIAAIGFIPFRRSNQPASAGTGMYLGPDEFETIYVQDNPMTRRASFGVPVSGDSMEPQYHDGDVLLVEKTEEVRVGEVGVFMIDGDGFVKVRGEGELISLNPNYAPRPMNESVRCAGRVIGILAPEWVK